MEHRSQNEKMPISNEHVRLCSAASVSRNETRRHAFFIRLFSFVFPFYSEFGYDPLEICLSRRHCSGRAEWRAAADTFQAFQLRAGRKQIDKSQKCASIEFPISFSSPKQKQVERDRRRRAAKIAEMGKKKKHIKENTFESDWTLCREE